MRGEGTKIVPTGDIFDKTPGEMSWIRGKLADHVGGHVVLSPEGAVLVTSPGTESSYSRSPHSLNDSVNEIFLTKKKMPDEIHRLTNHSQHRGYDAGVE